MPEFVYTDLLPVGQDTTQYRLLTSDGVRTREAFGRNFLEVDPAALTLLPTGSGHARRSAGTSSRSTRRR